MCWDRRSFGLLWSHSRRPGLRRNFALRNVCRFRADPYIEVLISRSRRKVGAEAQVGFFEQGHQVKFLILFAHDDVVARSHALPPEEKGVHGFRPLLRSTRRYPFFIGTVENSLRWADSRAHGAFALAGAVVAQVALLHIVSSYIELGYAEWAGVAAVLAVDAARLIR